MSEIKGQAAFFKFSKDGEAAQVAGAVIMSDNSLIVGGAYGDIPGDVARAMIDLAKRNGVRINHVQLIDRVELSAIEFGAFHSEPIWPIIAQGIAASSTAAIMDVIEHSGLFVDNLTDELGPDQK